MEKGLEVGFRAALRASEIVAVAACSYLLVRIAEWALRGAPVTP